MRSAAALLLACAFGGCVSPRAAFGRLWPGYDRAVFEVRDGREAQEALAVARLDESWGGRVEVRYQEGDAVVSESFVIEANGTRWRRRFVIEALPANRELVVRVPARAASGRLLEVAVNGAPLVAERGALESVVQLARDEATIIEVREVAER